MYYLNKFTLFFKKNQLKSIIIVLVLLILVPYLLLFGYCHPAGDDYSYAVLGSEPNFIKSLLDEYNLWNGRYTSNIFVLKGSLVYFYNSVYFYRCSLFIIFILFYFTIFKFIQSITGNYIGVGYPAFFSLLFFVLYLYQMPILSEGIYWYTGIVTYQLGIIFFLWLIILQLKYIGKIFIVNRIIHFVLLMIAAFLVVGFNEVLMLFIVLFYCILIQVYWTKYKQKRISFFILFLIVVGSIFIVYFAPGNTLRSTYFEGKSHQLWHSLLFSVLQCGRFIFEWLSNGVILLLSIAFISLHSKIEKHIFMFSPDFPISRWFSLFSLPIVIFISVFPAYWSTGIMGQHRTVNVAYFFFILLWFINLSIWINHSPIIFSRFKVSNIKYLFLLSLLIILFSKNTRIAWGDILSHSASKFDNQMSERYLELNKAKYLISKPSNVYITKLNVKPRSIFLYDISDDTNYFPNVCYRKYWKIEGNIVAK